MWMPAMLTAELIPVRFSIHAVLVVVLIWLGALQNPLGWLALGMTIITWIAYVVLQLRARRARHAVEDALAAAGIDTAHFAEVEIARVALAYPYRIPKQLRRIEDVEYAPGLHLDLYRSTESDEPGPVLLQIHGGSWGGGDKQQQARPLLDRMANRGWAAAAVAYPLAPEATFPEQLVGLKRALAWVRAEGSEHGMDPSFIAVTGGSAGGNLAALLALTQNMEEYQPGFEDVDTSLDAAVTLYGVYDLLNRHGAREPFWDVMRRFVGADPDEEPHRFREASPVDRVDANAPPFFVIHGSHDPLIPKYEAEMFVTSLRSVSAKPVLYAEIPGATHAFDNVHSLRTHYVISGIARFLEAMRTRADDPDRETDARA
jgi:acetyl esterase/lipase